MEMTSKEARDRCLAAIGECEDEDTQRALWRAAMRYNLQSRREELELAFQSFEEGETGATAGESAGPSLAALEGGSGLSREW
jgi:hypothetical protein